jgi:hypothetical protein
LEFKSLHRSESHRLSFDFTAYAAEPVLSEVEGLRMNGKNLGSGKVPFVLSVAQAKSKHEQHDLK